MVLDALLSLSEYAFGGGDAVPDILVGGLKGPDVALQFGSVLRVQCAAKVRSLLLPQPFLHTDENTASALNFCDEAWKHIIVALDRRFPYTIRS